MKKIITIILATAFSLALFTGCTEDAKDQIYPPMTGYWKCTSIGGTAFGVTSPSIENKYLSLFSIGYVGLAGSGYYTRTGTESLSSTAGAVTALTSSTSD